MMKTADELERENADHVEVRKAALVLLGEIRDEAMKHEDESPPKGFSHLRFTDLCNEMSCKLRGITIE